MDQNYLAERLTEVRYSAYIMEALALLSVSGTNSQVGSKRPVALSKEQAPVGLVKSLITPSTFLLHLRRKKLNISYFYYYEFVTIITLGSKPANQL